MPKRRPKRLLENSKNIIEVDRKINFISNINSRYHCSNCGRNNYKNFTLYERQGKSVCICYHCNFKTKNKTQINPNFKYK